MKIISLNTWAGGRFDDLINFIESERDTTDVFCFQEIFDTSTDAIILEDGSRANLYNEIKNRLNDFEGYFAAEIEGVSPGGPVDYNLSFGLASFIRKSLKVVGTERFFVHGQEGKFDADEVGHHPRIIFAVTVVDKQNKLLTILNFHGLWSKGFGKGDSAERLLQSTEVRKIMVRYSDPKILIGDFNLLPETESLAILKEGMRDLISEFKITTTRSSLYDKQWIPFADYAIISPEIDVESFEVPNVLASDHLPLILKIK